MAVKFLNGIDVEGSMNLHSSDIPNLDASKITSGTLSADRIPDLSGAYQIAGDYLTLETANTTFQPIGKYLTSIPSEYLTQTEGDARYLRSISSADVTDALGYVPYQQGTGLSAYTLTLSNIEKSNIDVDGEIGWDANDSSPAPAYLGSYGGSHPDGLYFKGSGTIYTVYHTGHFSGTNIANWETAYGWGNHASAGYLTSIPSTYATDAEVSTAVGTVDARINEEVIPYIDAVAADAAKGVTAYSWGNHASAGYLTSFDITTQTDSKYLRSNANDTATGLIVFNGGIQVLSGTGGGQFRLKRNSGSNTGDDVFDMHMDDGNIYFDIDNDLDADSSGFVFRYGTGGSFSNLLTFSSSDIAFKGNSIATQSYVNTAVSNLVDSAPGALNTLNELAAALGDDANFSTTVTNNIAAVDTRINDEVIPYIDAVAGDAAKGVTAYGWGDHSAAGYLTSVPSALSVTSIAVGSGATLTESTDRADLLMIKSSTSSWGGLQVSNTSNEGIISLMINDNEGGLYDDQNGEWILKSTENGGLTLGYNNVTKLTTTSAGVKISGTVTATGGNSTNWNTAYGWGNHASAGYLTSIPSDYVRQAQDIVSGNIHPLGDREQLLGLEENRWKIVFCEILDSAGQHEKNLQNPEGEKSVGDYPTGTVLVWKDGKNIPCTESADHMRMGIAVQGVASPLIQGAEPVLVTGTVNEGDYLVTSSVEGHAEAISPQFMRQHGLYDCVLGKALESGEGESYLLKTWINI